MATEADPSGFRVKLILSRKGFDSENGGVASPIFPDGTLYSLPIPSKKGPKRFGDLTARGGHLGVLAEQVTRGRVSSSTPIHLDPDIDPSALPRPMGWRPAFGQTGAAQGHLRKQGVGFGDLFLFYGWFREVEMHEGRWQYKRGAPNLHVLFGWLQVGEVLEVGAATAAYRAKYPWLGDHPHLHGDRDNSNTVYIANRKLILATGTSVKGAGAGVFNRMSVHRTLTAQSQPLRGTWQLPSWFYPSSGRTPLTYNVNPANWAREADGSKLVSASKGQEFVLNMDEYPEARTWLQRIFGGIRIAD